MSHSYWKTRSLRFWIGIGMLAAIVPLAASAAASYWLLNHGVIDAFHDVSMRERSQVAALQELRVTILDTLAPVDEFLEDADPAHAAAYRRHRTLIETEFAALQKSFAGEADAALLARALEDWTVADRHATELLSMGRSRGDAQLVETMARFHGAVQGASDRLGALYAVVAEAIEEDHRSAMLYRERVVWISGVAALLSALSVAAGVVLIGRVMASSVDRLVDGAARFGDGDRAHRISIEVPPELRRVAAEFNRMIERIDETETALADLARRDGLTKLLNRRAFDEAMEEAHARIRRYGEDGALMTLDIDHFKKINDEHGHAAGDEVLRVLAQRMASAMRPFDRAYRIGGEEFAVLLPNMTMEAAAEAAERLRTAVADEAMPLKHGGAIAVTVSIGVAEASGALPPAELLEAADAALYYSKASGRNRITVVDRHGMRPYGASADPIPLAALRAARNK
jgi:diguanylate cyclase (GGDEF)-like protein